MTDKDSYTAALTPLERKGLQAIEGFGNEIYKSAQQEFHRIEYNATVNDTHIKDKITKWIVATDKKSIVTLDDLVRLNNVETFEEVDQELCEQQITAQIVVASILTDHDSYPTHREITEEIIDDQPNSNKPKSEMKYTDAETVFRLIRAIKSCTPQLE